MLDGSPDNETDLFRVLQTCWWICILHVALLRLGGRGFFEAHDPVDLFCLGLFQTPDDLSQLIC